MVKVAQLINNPYENQPIRGLHEKLARRNFKDQPARLKSTVQTNNCPAGHFNLGTQSLMHRFIS